MALHRPAHIRRIVRREDRGISGIVRRDNDLGITWVE
jgi:hypothetical protein